MSVTEYSNEEVARRGELLYNERIRPHLNEVTDEGKLVVIDIETGEYEIDEDDIAATLRALAKRPDAITYGVRVGHRGVYRLGFKFVINAEKQGA